MRDTLNDIGAASARRAHNGAVPAVLNAMVQTAGVKVLPILQQRWVVLQASEGTCHGADGADAGACGMPLLLPTLRVVREPK